MFQLTTIIPQCIWSLIGYSQPFSDLLLAGRRSPVLTSYWLTSKFFNSYWLAKHEWAPPSLLQFTYLRVYIPSVTKGALKAGPSGDFYSHVDSQAVNLHSASRVQKVVCLAEPGRNQKNHVDPDPQHHSIYCQAEEEYILCTSWKRASIYTAYKMYGNFGKVTELMGVSSEIWGGSYI